MKTQAKKFLAKAPLLAIFIFSVLSTAAQPNYSFTSYSLTSGTDGQRGAVYLFTKVKNGVDAIVTIDTITPGTSIDTLDVTSTGFDAAFQPLVRVSAHKSGYAQFNIQFVKHGNQTPLVETDVAVTGIDIDGHRNTGDTVSEYDAFNFGPTEVLYDNPAGTEISVTSSASWITAKNVAGIEHTGVDTLSKDVMFTVSNASTTSFKIRTGVDNRSGISVGRYASVYFQQFTYTNSTLPLSPILNFTGNEKDGAVQLQWQVGSSSGLTSVSLERAYDAKDFNAIGQFAVTADSSGTSGFDYSGDIAQPAVFYRLKMLSQTGEVSYSDILSFRLAAASANAFRVYPTVIVSSATINVPSGKETTATLQIFDYSGRLVQSQRLQLANGDNNISVFSFAELRTGNYVAVLRTADNSYSQKIIKR